MLGQIEAENSYEEYAFQVNDDYFLDKFAKLEKVIDFGFMAIRTYVTVFDETRFLKDIFIFNSYQLIITYTSYHESISVLEKN